MKSDIIENSNFDSFSVKRDAISLSYNIRNDDYKFLLFFGDLLIMIQIQIIFNIC